MGDYHHNGNDDVDEDEDFAVGVSLTSRSHQKTKRHGSSHFNHKTPTKAGKQPQQSPTIVSPMLEKRQRAQGKNKGHKKERDAKALRQRDTAETSSSDESGPTATTSAVPKTPQKQSLSSTPSAGKKRGTGAGVDSVKSKALASLSSRDTREPSLSAKSPFHRSTPAASVSVSIADLTAFSPASKAETDRDRFSIFSPEQSVQRLGLGE
jgi:hypothetical protein